MLEGQACVSEPGGNGAVPLQLEWPGVLSLLGPVSSKDCLCVASHLSSAVEQEMQVPCTNLSFFCPVWFSRVHRRELHGQELPRPSHAGA